MFVGERKRDDLPTGCCKGYPSGNRNRLNEFKPCLKQLIFTSHKTDSKGYQLS